MRKILFVAAAMAALSFGAASAQDMSKMASDAAFAMPKACEPAAHNGGMAGMADMPGMKPGADGAKKEMSCMKDGKCTMMKGMDMTGGDAAGMPGMDHAQMDDAQKASMAAMTKMHGPMMAAHMIKDPDLAFTCGMLAHHMGAIEMSKVELKYGKDADARAMATKIIAAQEAEIAEMTAWIEKNAKK